MAETKTVTGASPVGSPTTHLRFQLDNHLGTCSVEVTEDGSVISYEEYHPYGTSAYRAQSSSGDVSAKRYRYTGKERDEETGLYYHGARYYAPWLGRWTAADPLAFADGAGGYTYSRASPVALCDPTGRKTPIVIKTSTRPNSRVTRWTYVPGKDRLTSSSAEFAKAATSAEIVYEYAPDAPGAIAVDMDRARAWAQMPGAAELVAGAQKQSESLGDTFETEAGRPGGTGDGIEAGTVGREGGIGTKGRDAGALAWTSNQLAIFDKLKNFGGGNTGGENATPMGVDGGSGTGDGNAVGQLVYSLVSAFDVGKKAIGRLTYRLADKVTRNGRKILHALAAVRLSAPKQGAARNLLPPGPAPPKQLPHRQLPEERYNRYKHYGKTPTAADRKAIGAGPGQVADHDPPLVQRYYEGDPNRGEWPGFTMSQEQRVASGADRSRMFPQPVKESQKQGGTMRAFSQKMRKKYFGD